MVAQLNDLCYSYFDFCFDHIFPNPDNREIARSTASVRIRDRFEGWESYHLGGDDDDNEDESDNGDESDGDNDN